MELIDKFPNIDDAKPAGEIPEEIEAEVDDALRELFPAKFHLPDQHDQLDHGNWAHDPDRSAKTPVNQMPEEQRKKFLKLEAESLDKDIEVATIAYSSPRGSNMVVTKAGNTTSVEFEDDELAAMKRDGNVVFSHNHPTTPFGDLQTVAGLSLADIMLAMRVDMKEMRAVARHESGDYVFSITRPSHGWPSRFEVENFINDDETYGKMLDVAKARWEKAKQERPQAEAYALSRQINLALSHARTKRIAENFEIPYRMVKISSKNVRA